MYTTPIDQITYTHIARFVRQRPPESIILDYKQDWPKDLEKPIAAMANTQGGVILVGVAEEEKTGMPLPVIPGVDLGGGQDALKQRVNQIAYQAIYPPVMPEVHACSLGDNSTRAVVVIRVSPSDHAPHAIDNRRKVYVRVDSITPPHDNLAPLEQLEWLWDRRRKAIESRNALVAAAIERSAWMVRRRQPSRGAEQREDTKEVAELPLLRAWTVPYFHTGQQSLTSQAVKELVRDRRVQSRLGRGPTYFPCLPNHIRSVPSGYCTYGTDEWVQEYYEICTAGLLFVEFSTRLDYPGAPPRGVNYLATLAMVDGLLKFADLAYQEGRLWGLLHVQASLHHIQGAVVDIDDKHLMTPSEMVMHQCPEHSITLVDETVDRFALEERRPQLIREATRTLLWAFGYDWDDGRFESWYLKKVWH